MLSTDSIHNIEVESYQWQHFFILVSVEVNRSKLSFSFRRQLRIGLLSENKLFETSSIWRGSGSSSMGMGCIECLSKGGMVNERTFKMRNGIVLFFERVALDWPLEAFVFVKESRFTFSNFPMLRRQIEVSCLVCTIQFRIVCSCGNPTNSSTRAIKCGRPRFWLSLFHVLSDEKPL